MSDWIISISGTAEGARLAAMLALLSAFAHAFFGALQKGRHDPWLSRGAIDFALMVITLPVVLFVVPAPEGWLWLILAGTVPIHFAYKWSMARAYERGAYTVIYPVVRGTGPLVTVVLATIFFSERYAPAQWAGVALLSGGILFLAWRNLRDEVIAPEVLKVGLLWALLTGGLVAAYTTYDAWGIRQAPNVFTFLAWFFFLTALDFPLIAYVRWRRDPARPAPLPLLARGLLGAVVAWVSFGGVMLATRLDSVGEAAVLRETSTVFAALIGWLVLGERVGPRKALAMAVIALGAVFVELGG